MLSIGLFSKEMYEMNDQIPKCFTQEYLSVMQGLNMEFNCSVYLNLQDRFLTFTDRQP